MSASRRLTVIAHWDPDGLVAPHVLRLVEAFAAASETTIVSSTATLQPEARDALRDRALLVERENHGQDFAGWKQAIDEHLWDGGYDELVVTNDTYVGPLVPVDDLAGVVERQGVDVWGASENFQHGRHLQSFLLGFTEPVLRSRTFRTFWDELEPAAQRHVAIFEQEIGISRRLLGAGFRLGGYYKISGDDVPLARARRAHYTRAMNERDRAEGRPEDAVRIPAGPANPAVGCADSVFRGGLPLVKIETLRWDPWLLDSDRLLTLCEESFPEAFAGVRDYLARTAPAYPGRPGENTASATVPAELADTVGYHR